MAAHKTGGDVDSYCNKCKLVLAHVIIAMDGTRVVRVECKTCRAVHGYRKSAESSSRGSRTAGSSTTTRRAATKSTTGRAAAISQADYDKVIRGQDLSRAQRYRATINFAEGDVVDHMNFGLGMVMRLMGDSKMEVLFPTGVKVLVHSR